MTSKLKVFESSTNADHLHCALIKLPGVKYDASAQGPTIGYRVNGQTFKFATLHGGKAYQSLVLHMEPGNPVSAIGKEKQREIQEVLDFDIRKCRSHLLKRHEVYIPFEKLDCLSAFASIQPFINEAMEAQEKEGRIVV
ncbi:hypothetical protein SAMN05421743_101273 [Thalassobacillus cyri]|uniref:Uncharacterized protein n=1 Tax=Thalassobacillus cyri TaxID=571932 RepID=A0A1H3W2L7_9BACI|nr:hypothetical protein [Thalassobacillus cyri]SDZ80654.1 hypothetical protein SAMN05421743_101273 [Thalassobacillus cyri]